MTRILGIDVCQDSAVCWLLDTFPSNPKNYWKQECKNRSKNPIEDSLTFYFTKEGLKDLFSLEFDYIALEPTGMHYSALLATACEKHNRKILWVAHTPSKNHRASLKLPDKNDLADSFALAHYSLRYLNEPNYFIDFIPGKIARLKQVYLESKSLCRYQGPLINRIKQQLSYEFPEASSVLMQPKADGRRALICWLAGRERPLIKKYCYWDNRYKESVALEYGIEISSYTRQLAAHIDDYDIWQLEIAAEMRQLVFSSEFEAYNQVFDEFNFHLGLRALLLSLIYPFSRFPGMPEFKKRIGSAQREESSGNTAAWKTGDGSSLCRSELYIWCMMNITDSEKKANAVPDSEVGRAIQARYKEWKIQFSVDPDKWTKHYQLQTLQGFLAKLETMLSDDVVSTLSTSKQESFRRNLEKVKNAMFDGSELDKLVPTSNANKKFGILILNKTIGYTARLLYRRLRDSLK